MRLRSSRAAILLPLLLALTSCDLYPDSGKWGGTLTVHDENWKERYSCSVDIDITHTAQVVSLNSIDSFCGSRSLHWSMSALNRRGTSLYKDDQEVGRIYADGTVRIELRDPHATAHYPNYPNRLVITWTRLGEELQFSLREENEGRVQIFESTLQRVR